MLDFSPRQHGLSLIELMVVMVISCFLILGITQFYIDDRSSALFQQGQVNNLDKSRFANLILEQLLSRTGYRTQPWESMENSFPLIGSSSGCPVFAAGETLLKNTAGDGVCLRYQAANDEEDGGLDCFGEALVSDADVLLNLSYDNVAGTLNCRVGDTSAVLVDDVASFVFGDLPGRDDDNQSVNFAVLLSNGANLRGGVSSDVLARWNSLSGEQLATDSTQIFQIVQGSVMLRNLMQ
jgi:type IV pilus assembly protein PilW